MLSAMTAAVPPRLWHATHPDSLASQASAPILVGRQGVYSPDGELHGYELLFRTAGLRGVTPDLWDVETQDLATEHVIAAAFHQGTDVIDGLDASVNFTGNYLLTRADLGCDPRSVIIEIVESTPLVPGLIERVAALRDQGFRIALDDFMETAAQCALLPLADFVKVDRRDLDSPELGPALVDRARGSGRILVAERIETQEQLDVVVALGFDQVQGHVFQQAEVLSIPTPAQASARR